MRVLISGLLGLIIGLTGCQTPPPPVLEPLTLAELHRQDLQGPRPCRRLESGGWECDSQSAYSFSTREIPYEIAPFMAQIYLHPAYTTEEDLIRQGAKDLPRWTIRHVCGGALIAPNWIATAAHCLPDPALDKSYGVRIGMNKITEDFGELYRVEEVVRRNPDRPTRENDLALVRFSPDDAVVQSLLNSNIWNFVRGATKVRDVVFDFADDTLMALDNDGMLEVLNRKTGERAQTAGFAPNVLTVDRKTLFKWNENWIFETPLDDPTPRNQIPFASLSNLAHIPNRDVLVGYSSATGVVRVIDRTSGNTVFEVAAPVRGGHITLVADQTRALVGHNQSGLIDLLNGEVIPMSVSSDAFAYGLFANDTRLLFQDPNTGETESIDAYTGETVAIDMLAPIETLYYSTSSTYFLTESEDEPEIAIYDAATLDHVSTIVLSDEAERSLLQWSSDGETLYFVRGGESPLEILDPRNPQNIETLYFGEGWSVTDIVPTKNPDIQIVTVSILLYEDGVPMLMASEDFAVQPNGQSVLLKVGPGADVSASQSRSVVWEALPDGRVLQVNLTEGRTYVWDVASCGLEVDQCLPVAQLDHSVPLFEVEFANDQRTAIAFAMNGTVQLWSLESGEELVRVFHGGIQKGARFDRAKNELLTFGANGFLRIWDVESGQEVQRFDFADYAPPGLRPDPVEVSDAEPVPPHIFTTYLKIDEIGANLRDGEPVRIFGWGRYGSDEDQNRSPKLREGGLQILTSETCRAPEYWGDHKDLHDRVFCAHDLERKTCVGDSGGPVVQGQHLEDLTLVGISSWGSSRCSADGKPGVYTRIASHADWIKSVIGADLPESVASPDPVSP